MPKILRGKRTLGIFLQKHIIDNEFGVLSDKRKLSSLFEYIDSICSGK
jgi:hypothetical protein